MHCIFSTEQIVLSVINAVISRLCTLLYSTLDVCFDFLGTVFYDLRISELRVQSHVQVSAHGCNFLYDFESIIIAHVDIYSRMSHRHNTLIINRASIIC